MRVSKRRRDNPGDQARSRIFTPLLASGGGHPESVFQAGRAVERKKNTIPLRLGLQLIERVLPALSIFKEQKRFGSGGVLLPPKCRTWRKRREQQKRKLGKPALGKLQQKPGCPSFRFPFRAASFAFSFLTSIITKFEPNCKTFFTKVIQEDEFF